jgi:hypothetical protein
MPEREGFSKPIHKLVGENIHDLLFNVEQMKPDVINQIKDMLQEYASPYVRSRESGLIIGVGDRAEEIPATLDIIGPQSLTIAEPGSAYPTARKKWKAYLAKQPPDIRKDYRERVAFFPNHFEDAHLPYEFVMACSIHPNLQNIESLRAIVHACSIESTLVITTKRDTGIRWGKLSETGYVNQNLEELGVNIVRSEPIDDTTSSDEHIWVVKVN